MDLGAAADGIAQAYLAFMFLGSIAVHAIAVGVAIIGLVFGGRAAQICSVMAVMLVAANHIGLVYLGAWEDVVWNLATVWTVVFLAGAGLIGAVALRSPCQCTHCHLTFARRKRVRSRDLQTPFDSDWLCPYCESPVILSVSRVVVGLAAAMALIGLGVGYLWSRW